ncbi:MAG: hypothetical protein U1F60_13000 [Planctomycetota bacterium]
MNRDRVLQIYERMVGSQPGIEVKGASTRYTSMNGNMFSFVTAEGGIALRLGEADGAVFRADHGTAEVVQHGATLRGYVLVPAALLAQPAELAKWFAASVANARTLPTKATTRKVAAKRGRTAKK